MLDAGKLCRIKRDGVLRNGHGVVEHAEVGTRKSCHIGEAIVKGEC